MTIKALRGPSSNSRGYTSGPFAVPLSTRHTVNLAFSAPSGKGDSDFVVQIGSEDFANLAQAMMDLAPEEAVKAFGAAMVAGSRALDEVAFFESLADEDDKPD